MSVPVDPVQLTTELVRINTVNPPGREDACARHLGVLLGQAGFRVRYHSYGDGRSSLVATIGAQSEKPPHCLTGHIATVPLGAARWSMDPFAAETADSKLYGRGASDMKCGVAALTVAALRLASRI